MIVGRPGDWSVVRLDERAECPDCGWLILPYYMRRHRGSKQCGHNQAIADREET